MNSKTVQNVHPEPSRPKSRNTDLENPRSVLLAGLPVTERRLDLAGISTPILEGGDGPPMILLHGPGEHAPKWLRIIPDLVKTHRVIVPDLPGHGATEVKSGVVDLNRVVSWLDELIARTCSTAPVLLGQIIGGAIAARYAVGRGDRLDRLILCDTLGLVPFQPAAEFGMALQAFLADPSEKTHDGLWAQCAFDLKSLQKDMGERWFDLRAYNLDRARAGDLKALQQELFGQFGVPAIPDEDLGRIAVPTTLIWGRHDLATPLSAAQGANARYGWPLYVVENAADDPAMEQPRAFLATLRKALAKRRV